MLQVTFGCSLTTFLPAGVEAPAPKVPPTELPTLILQEDEGSVGYSLHWYLLYQQRLRFVHFRDIYHREWNDVKLAIKSCGLWWAVLLSSVALNIHWGPWLTQAWFQKHKEGADEFFRKCTPADPLFLHFYEELAREQGIEPDHTFDQKASLLKELHASDLFENKGPKVAINRWFSWMQAAREFDPKWTLHLLVSLVVGLETGVYRKRQQCPGLRRPTSQQQGPKKDEEEGDAEEAKKAVAAAAGAATGGGGRHRTRSTAQQARAPPRRTRTWPR